MGCTQAPITDTFNARCMDESEFEMEKLATSLNLLESVIEDTELNFDLPSCANASRVRIIPGTASQCDTYCELQKKDCRLIEQRAENFTAYKCIPLDPSISIFSNTCDESTKPGFEAKPITKNSFTKGTYYLEAQRTSIGATHSICGYRKK